MTAGNIVTLHPFRASTRYCGPYARVPGEVPWQGKPSTDDPFIFGDYYGDDGLIRDYGSALTVRSIYSEIHTLESLQILWVVSEADDTRGPENSRFIGIDVASPHSPFYSPVFDLSARIPNTIDQFGVSLNSFGLLETVEDGRKFLADYRQLKSGITESDRNRDYTLWRVHLVEQS